MFRRVVPPRAAGDFFASSLAAGDFNGDGCVDLAIGVVGEHIPNDIEAGAVHVLYGSSPYGLSAIFGQFWYQGYSGVKDQPEPTTRLAPR
jgi:FG-GAP repeat